jgi:RNA recognition motif-containing protein
MPEERGIFVRNLPYDTTQAQLEEFFGTVGPVKRVNIITEKCAQRSRASNCGLAPSAAHACIGRHDPLARCRGFAFIFYALDADAHEAVKTLQGKALGGRKLSLDFARDTKARYHAVWNSVVECIASSACP